MSDKARPLCPHCTTKYRDFIDDAEIGWLEWSEGANALSRRDNKTYICFKCARAEAIADMVGISDDMARKAVETDYQEAVRIPGRMVWGPTMMMTGGWEEYSREMDLRGLPHD